MYVVSDGPHARQLLLVHRALLERRDGVLRLGLVLRPRDRDLSNPTTGGGFVATAVPIEATTPSVIMSRKEDLDKLEKAIDELKPEYREVIVLTKIEGLSYKEIGNRLSKSPDAVRMLVPSAMAELTTVFMRI